MADVEQLLANLSDKRERLDQTARRGREARDALNDVTKTHSHRRDELNAQVRGIVEKANAHRAARDAANQKVRDAKAERDRLNMEARAKSDVLHAMRRERGLGGEAGGVPLPRLKQELRALEYQQQTTVLTPQKEKALIELIAAKQKEIKQREGAAEEHADLKDAYEAMRQAKAAAEAAHAHVTEMANAAQAEHDAMVALFAEADGLRKQADEAQREFVKAKQEADRAHRDYIESVGALRDLDKVGHFLRGTTPSKPGESPTASAAVQADADAIFDRFRKGEKLSTEDLMALQKAGRL